MGLLLALVSTSLAEQLVPYVEASRCGGCHRTIYAQWRASQMANSASDEVYQDLYQIALREDTGWAIACARCHEPRAVVGDKLVPTPVSRLEGVACDYCHRIADVRENDQGDVVHTHFDLGSDRQAVKHGPLSDAVSPFHKTQYSAAYSQARYCGMCHQYTAPNGIATEQQYAQWKETGLEDANVFCQTCHMPARPGKVSYVPPTAPYRQEVHQHRFGGGDSPTRLLGSFQVFIEKTARRKVEVTILNAVAGHNVPGHAHGLRRLYLVIEVKNSQGNILKTERRTYQRTFRLASGEPTLYFWQADAVAEDNTIPSGQTRTVTVTLPRGASTVEARVDYQRYPESLIEQFAWKGRLARTRTIASSMLDLR
jgi:hypothetical protein